MELLSPAGNIQAAYSAFKGGADAIYIGGKSFSARASADNFNNEEMKEIVFFAHSIGKKVYVTLNTLLFQDEFFEAVEFAKFLYQIKVDGVIVQDLGLAHYLHKVLPNLPLNASTQLNCHNVRQAEALIAIGFKRIVLARETSLQIAQEIKKLGVEVEVFGHGALCVSYSGNCLLSSFIGDRSGNRGRCAQPCRMRYDLLENGEKLTNDFAISTKDLMSLDNINDFIDIGVDSLKIEGRLKSNEYIYAVSKAYRHAIDAAIYSTNNKSLRIDKEELTKIFNRQFTKGYVENESPFEVLNTRTSSHQGEVVGQVVSTYKNRVAIKLSTPINRLDGIRFNSKEQFGLTIEKMFLNRVPVESANKGDTIELSGIENPMRFNNVEVIKSKDYKLAKRIEEELKNKIKVNVSATFEAEANRPIKLIVKLLGQTITVFGDVAQVPESNGTTCERIEEQLKKSGEYPYQITSISLNVDKCFIPISSINKIRNDAFDKLQKSLIKTNELLLEEYASDIVEIKRNKTTKVIVENEIQEDIVKENELYAFSYKSEFYKYENRVNNKIIFSSPNEIMHFIIKNDTNQNFIASQYCNITNSYALDCFYEMGFKECVLSSELNNESIKLLVNDFKNRHGFMPNVGIHAYGKLDMMIMKSCPIGTFYKNKNIHCERCHKNLYELNDRIGVRYRLIGDSSCNTRILMDKPINLLDKIDEINNNGVNLIYIHFTDEAKEKVNEILTHYLDNRLTYNASKYSRGHYNRRPL